jgi:hypothetical protein
MGNHPFHTSGEFTVEKVTPELMTDLEVKKWSIRLYMEHRRKGKKESS